PVTYLVDGKQYLTVAVGWGGAWGTSNKNTEHVYPGRIYTFALGENQPAPVLNSPTPKVLIEGEVTATEQQIAQGAALMGNNCAVCHGDAGDGGGNIPDLAYSSKAMHQNIQKIVREGMLESVGMPNLGNKLTAEEVELIQQYIFAKAKALQTSVAQKSDG
ncbi:MAG: c-type cytochrome, partial [Cyclobacteriaceae bacterium]|nr:c-type cytochrome [Cyclobacteriaceae bacterium]